MVFPGSLLGLPVMPPGLCGYLLTVPVAPMLAPLAIYMSVSPPDDERCEGRAGSCSSLNHWYPGQGPSNATSGPQTRKFKHQTGLCLPDGTERYPSLSEAKEAIVGLL